MATDPHCSGYWHDWLREYAEVVAGVGSNSMAAIRCGCRRFRSAI